MASLKAHNFQVESLKEHKYFQFSKNVHKI